MRKSILVSLALLFAANTAVAEQYQIFGCKYKEGKGPADLRQWFDTHAKPAFDAVGFEAEITVITPTINNNPDVPDFYWIEKWPDLATFGKTAGFFFDPGAKYQSVVEEGFKNWTCTNSVWAGVVFHKGK